MGINFVVLLELSQLITGNQSVEPIYFWKTIPAHFKPNVQLLHRIQPNFTQW